LEFEFCIFNITSDFFNAYADEREAESAKGVELVDIKPEVEFSESGDYYSNYYSDSEPQADKPSNPNSPADGKVDISRVKVEEDFDPTAPRKCSCCDEEFDSLIELSKHALTHCGVRITRLRKKYFLRRRAVKVRKVGSSSARPKTQFVNSKLKDPAKLSEPVYHNCHVCQEKFRVKTLLVAHVRNEHPGELPFKCVTCGKSFGTVRSLKYHLEASHPNPTNPISHLCPMCGKTFGVHRNLQKHMANVHYEEKRFKCPYCPYASSTSSQLAQHKNRHLKREQEQCPHCGIFKAKPSMKHHIEAVHEGKRLK